MSLRIEEKDFFTKTYRTRSSDTWTNQEQFECEKSVEFLFQSFLSQKKCLGIE